MDVKVSVSSSDYASYLITLTSTLRNLFVDWGYPEERAKKAAIRAVFGQTIVSELESAPHVSSE